MLREQIQVVVRKKRWWEETENNRHIGKEGRLERHLRLSSTIFERNREKSTLTENIIKPWNFLAEDPVKVTVRNYLGQSLDQI